MRKSVRLTAGERQNWFSHNGRRYTVVSRPCRRTGQSCLVSVVLENGRIVRSHLVTSLQAVPQTVRDLVSEMAHYGDDILREYDRGEQSSRTTLKTERSVIGVVGVTCCTLRDGTRVIGGALPKTWEGKRVCISLEDPE